ncbi:Cytoplasmic tRNA 2-thiolation protein 2 [Malassezia nana]|uniref:Cytoplasmic tRNA 2-thiolation protein 2 n=1 Tax=Malassezia nana TaxID=180528 RepID=A0AAF0EJA2_9BASI|nr:Cytoplasmic tRNA 2-thiolation protein 2 [Malassezia nana]
MAASLRCVRCREADAALAVREAAYCRTCYARVFDGKVRASLDLARGAILWHSVVRTMPPPTPPALAVSFDARLPSCVLLHAVHRLLREAPGAGASHPVPARAPEQARLDVLYVDDTCLVPGASDRSAEIQACVAALAPSANLVRIPLHAAWGQDAQVPSTLCTVTASGLPLQNAAPRAPAEALEALMAGLQQTSSKSESAAARTRVEDMHAILVRRVLCATARARQCAALLFAQDASDTAAHTLAAISKGAGHKLPVTGAASLWIDDVLHVHPLRMHLPQEVSFYAEEHGIQAVSVPTLFPPQPPAPAGATYDTLADKTTLGRLADSLIVALQQGVSSTSSTVVGTLSKLVMLDTPLAPTVPPSVDVVPRIGAKGVALVRAAQGLPVWDPIRMRSCPLCREPAQQGAADWKARTAMGAALVPTRSDTDAIDLAPRACYACLQVLDVPSGTTLPLPADVLSTTLQPEGAAMALAAPPSAEAAPDDSAAEMNAAMAVRHRPNASHAAQRVSPDAMRAQVASFLLE